MRTYDGAGRTWLGGVGVACVGVRTYDGGKPVGVRMRTTGRSIGGGLP